MWAVASIQKHVTTLSIVKVSKLIKKLTKTGFILILQIHFARSKTARKSKNRKGIKKYHEL